MGALCGSHEACPVWIIAEEKVCTNSTIFNVYTHFHWPFSRRKKRVREMCKHQCPITLFSCFQFLGGLHFAIPISSASIQYLAGRSWCWAIRFSLFCSNQIFLSTKKRMYKYIYLVGPIVVHHVLRGAQAGCTAAGGVMGWAGPKLGPACFRQARALNHPD